MIDIEAILDGIDIIVGTSCLLTTRQHTMHKFILGDIEADNGVELRTTLSEQLLEGISLWDGAREAIEHDTLLGGSLILKHIVEDADHQIVGDQLPLRDKLIGGDAEFGTALNMVAEKFACADMIQAVSIDQTGTLSAFAATGSAKNNYIEHFKNIYLTKIV